MYNSDDTIAYEGEIKNGLPHGKGKVKTGDGFVEANWNEGIDVSLIQEWCLLSILIIQPNTIH